MLKKAYVIGNETLAWAKAMLAEKGLYGTRILNGLLSLRKKHESSAINTGCAKALEAQEFTYQGLKQHIIHAAETQQNFRFIDEHPLIRETKEYDEIINSKGLFQ